MPYGYIYNGTSYYYEKNAQGDVVGLFHQNGKKIANYTYDAWGNITSIKNQYGEDVSSQPRHQANLNPIRYRGYHYDAELNMYWLTTRFYDPNVGRFINADTQLNDGMLGNNLYAYCGNDPVNLCDCTGNCAHLTIFGDTEEDMCGSCREAAVAYNALKPIILKVLETLWGIPSNITVELGWGTGIGFNTTFIGFDIACGYDLSMVFEGSIARGFDLGIKETEGGSIGLTDLKYIQLSNRKSIFHSYFCKRYKEAPGHEPYNCILATREDESLKMDISLIGFSIYLIGGVKAGIGFDYLNFIKEMEAIWR